MALTDRDYMRRDEDPVRTRGGSRPGFWSRLRFALWLFWRGLWQRDR